MKDSAIQMKEHPFAAAVVTAAGASTPVVDLHTQGKRRLRLRVLCDNAYEVLYALADAPMTALTDGCVFAAVAGAAVTSGKGNVHDIDVGSFAHVAVQIHNTGADASTISAGGKVYDPS